MALRGESGLGTQRRDLCLGASQTLHEIPSLPSHPPFLRLVIGGDPLPVTDATCPVSLFGDPGVLLGELVSPFTGRLAPCSPRTVLTSGHGLQMGRVDARPVWTIRSAWTGLIERVTQMVQVGRVRRVYQQSVGVDMRGDAASHVIHPELAVPTVQTPRVGPAGLGLDDLRPEPFLDAGAGVVGAAMTLPAVVVLGAPSPSDDRQVTIVDTAYASHNTDSIMAGGWTS
jgi:hypothetical protein